jgi:hypothetical protein
MGRLVVDLSRILILDYTMGKAFYRDWLIPPVLISMHQAE